MSDDLPFYHRDKKPQPRTGTPGEVLWTLRKGARILRCELRDDSKRGAGWDVQVLEHDDFLAFAQRCPLERSAWFVAASFRRDFLRDGWVHPSKEAERRRSL